jgi:hypothetical protein
MVEYIFSHYQLRVDEVAKEWGIPEEWLLKAIQEWFDLRKPEGFEREYDKLHVLSIVYPEFFPTPRMKLLRRWGKGFRDADKQDYFLAIKPPNPRPASL